MTNSSLSNSSLYRTDKWLITCTSTTVICNQVLNLFLGLPLNSYILFLLFTGGLGMDLFLTFIMNQSVSEIFLSLTAPLSIMCHVNITLCYLQPLGFFWGISMSARCVFQCCVSMERYLAVVHPITFRKYNQRRYRLTCSAVTWTSSLAFSIWSMIIFPRLPFNLLGVLYCSVLSVDLFCCFSILKVLRSSGPGGVKKERESKEACMNMAKRKAFTIVFFNLVIFLIQTIPICATFILHKNFVSLEAFNLSVAICLLINVCAGLVQPVVFLHKVGKLTLHR